MYLWLYRKGFETAFRPKFKEVKAQRKCNLTVTLYSNKIIGTFYSFFLVPNLVFFGFHDLD